MINQIYRTLIKINNNRKELKAKSTIYSMWNNFTKKKFNKPARKSYEMTDIEIRDYGFDAIIEFKNDFKYEELHKKRFNIEDCFGSCIYIKKVPFRRQAELKVYLYELEEGVEIQYERP